MTEGRLALPIAMSLAVMVMVWALVMRAVDVAGGAAASATTMLPLLFTAAGLCAAGLLRRRSPRGAWLATVAAIGIAALDIVGVIRGWQATAESGDGPWLAAAAHAALVVTAGVAAAYAVRTAPGSRTRLTTAWHLVVLAGLITVAGAASLAVVATFDAVTNAVARASLLDPASPLRASGRLAFGFLVAATLGGAISDLAGPWRRAWTRAPSLREFPRALGDEVLPSSAAWRRRGEEDERARLAAELHARLLPDLRRAAESASEPAATGLRRAVEDVEQLMHARQSIVLEEYGLVAALEWLAERTEQRGPLRVELEFEGAEVEDPASVPLSVGRAAFRVALLAMDNVARHAGAKAAVIRLNVDAGGLNLSVADDGTGFDGDTAPRSGRGLIDMRTTAADVGAVVRVGSLATGTAVEFAWTRTANPSAGSREPTSSPGSARD